VVLVCSELDLVKQVVDALARHRRHGNRRDFVIELVQDLGWGLGVGGWGLGVGF
jgi:hypothetical protein